MKPRAAPHESLRNGFEIEFGDDGEVGATTAEGPVEGSMSARGGGDDGTRGGNNFEGGWRPRQLCFL